MLTVFCSICSMFFFEHGISIEFYLKIAPPSLGIEINSRPYNWWSDYYLYQIIYYAIIFAITNHNGIWDYILQIRECYASRYQRRASFDFYNSLCNHHFFFSFLCHVVLFNRGWNHNSGKSSYENQGISLYAAYYTCRFVTMSRNIYFTKIFFFLHQKLRRCCDFIYVIFVEFTNLPLIQQREQHEHTAEKERTTNNFTDQDVIACISVISSSLLLIHSWLIFICQDCLMYTFLFASKSKYIKEI